jgi:pimeloyl-ACP methyl ester carboxylesterase
MKKIFLTLALAVTSTLCALAQGPVKNIVLVHGAFADGSGWEGVYNILTKQGYNVVVDQNPLSSLEDDVASVNRILDKLDGPVILVGHSWGGAVISQAAPTAPEYGILPPDNQGNIYIDKAKFHKAFCADLPAAKAAFMCASQGTWSAKGPTTPLTVAAWKTKPSWAIVATGDKCINPIIERRMYKRAGSKVTELNGSHVVFISQPAAVAKVIVDAATHAGK